MATLEVVIRLTRDDGLVETTSGDYQFPTEDEAEEMYWAFINASASGSKAERDRVRGKSGQAPGQNK